MVSKTLYEVEKYLKPGVSTLFLDKIAEAFILDNHAIPAFKNYRPNFNQNPYPYTLCISINDAVVHGIPNEKTILKEGDIISIDCGVKLGDYFGDSAYTFYIGDIRNEVKRLLLTTHESLYKGIEKANVGNKLGDIGYAIQSHVESKKFSVVKEMVGHGIGKSLHESPEVPNYGKRGYGVDILEGMVLAIEPMINLGKRYIYVDKDDWTIRTMDGLSSAHFEHTIAIINGKAEILSSFDFFKQQYNN